MELPEEQLSATFDDDSTLELTPELAGPTRTRNQGIVGKGVDLMLAPRVRAYVKNQGLGLDVPYRDGSVSRIYIPDFILKVDDGHGADDLLNLIVEIKGRRQEDAKRQKERHERLLVPGVNNLGGFGRWAFAEITEAGTMGETLDAAIAGGLG